MPNTLLILSIALAASSAYCQARPATSPAKAVVAVFDFAPKANPALGRDIADRIRTRLARHADEFTVLDALTMTELTPAGGITPQTTDAQMAALLTGKIAATAAIWGEVTVTGDRRSLSVRYFDLSGPAPRRWAKAFDDTTERFAGILARQVVEAIRSRAEWTPPEYGDEIEPADLGAPLNVNGTFDATAYPAPGWEPLDGAAARWVSEKGRGRVLSINTHLDRNAWLAWRRKVRFGAGDPRTPPKIDAAANKYANIGAMEGVHVTSNWLPAAAGERYWLTADVKGPISSGTPPMVFVKGYADMAATADALSELSLHERSLTADAFARMPTDTRKKIIADEARKHPDRYRREVYRWYLACRGQPGQWTHCAAPFPPRGGLPANVKHLRIQVYAYWPLGEYRFDNVHLYKTANRRISNTEFPMTK